MEEKYLPIGTIVTINSSAKKVMITGYYSVEYNNSVKLCDYSGCVYPEGLLQKNSIVSFNHEDIKSVDFMGYENDDFDVLNKKLNGTKEDVEEVKEKKFYNNYKFDENGVVVFEDTSILKMEPQIVKVNKPEEPKNPFEIDFDKVDNQPEPNVEHKYKFDENGIVIEDEIVKNNKDEINSNIAYKFDENGVVIGEEVLYPEQDNGNVIYKFDENGIVIGEEVVNAESNNDGKVEYKFDENGIVTEEVHNN